MKEEKERKLWLIISKSGFQVDLLWFDRRLNRMFTEWLVAGQLVISLPGVEKPESPKFCYNDVLNLFAKWKTLTSKEFLSH